MKKAKKEKKQKSKKSKKSKKRLIHSFFLIIESAASHCFRWLLLGCWVAASPCWGRGKEEKTLSQAHKLVIVTSELYCIVSMDNTSASVVSGMSPEVTYLCGGKVV
jgi:hypothetical protein